MVRSPWSTKVTAVSASAAGRPSKTSVYTSRPPGTISRYSPWNADSSPSSPPSRSASGRRPAGRPRRDHLAEAPAPPPLDQLRLGQRPEDQACRGAANSRVIRICVLGRGRHDRRSTVLPIATIVGRLAVPRPAPRPCVRSAAPTVQPEAAHPLVDRAPAAGRRAGRAAAARASRTRTRPTSRNTRRCLETSGWRRPSARDEVVHRAAPPAARTSKICRRRGSATALNAVGRRRRSSHASRSYTHMGMPRQATLFRGIGLSRAQESSAAGQPVRRGRRPTRRQERCSLCRGDCTGHGGEILI